MWIKVCGCTDPQNAAEVARAGVAAIGLNFYAKSKRYIGDRADAVREAIGDSAEVVGLFVNESAEAILETVDRLSLDSIQLHGDEPADIVEALRPHKVYRAVRVPNGAIQFTVNSQLAAFEQGEQPLPPNLAALLIDAASTRGLGGTGETIDWVELREAMQKDWPRIVLAGGLSPANVKRAVEVVRPYGVDVASGVESQPGLKDVAAVRQFVSEALAARPT